MVLLSPLFFVPSLLKARATSALESRTGLVASVDHVSLGAHGASLAGVHLKPRDGAGVQIDVEQVDAEFGWFSALVRGASAVKSVQAKGVDAEVDIASPAFAELRQKLSAKSDTSESSSGTHTQRNVEATRFALTVRDGEHELLVVDGVSAQVSPTQITSSLNRLRAQKPGLAAVAMTGVEATLERDKELRVSNVRVDEARISIETPVLPSGAISDRDRAHDDDDDDTADPDPSAQPSTAAPVVAKPSGERQKSLQSLLARLAPDAVLELKRARIEQVSGRESLPILNDVACEIRLQPDGAIRVTGKGAAQAGGRLHVDMRFWPADLRADGRVTMTALPLTLFVPILPSVPWYEPEKSRINTELTIKAESPARVFLEGYANLTNLSVSATRLATTPVQGIDFSIAGRGHWQPLERRLEIETGSIGLGKAKADVRGAVEITSDHYAFDLNANMRPTPCTDAVRSIPAALLGDMALAEWRGNIAAKLRFQTDSRDLDKTELKVDITDRCGFEVVPVNADLSRFARPFVHTVTEPDGTVFEMETGPGTDNWTPIESMSPYFVTAVMIHEDPQFFFHHGFSPVNIRNALVRDLRERRYAVGASTISMQLVKNVFLHREKTLARKIQEVLLTWWTERVMEKRDILELYLNVIEYGPGIYGIRNAAQHYWNRMPSELSPAEGVFLATILPAPKRFHSQYDRNALSSGPASNMRSFMRRLGERGAFDKEATDFGLQELEHFRFTREGQAAPPRTVPGSAAPLPYQQALRDQAFDNTTTNANTAHAFGSAPRSLD
ncbi:MAG: hypothetical protein RL701_3037 [Pseudomonadota bacterium]